MAKHLSTCLIVVVARVSVCIGTAVADQAPQPKPLDGTGISEPTDPVQKAAFDVLYQHCARCHQHELLEPPYTQPADGFDNILHLQEYEAKTSVIVPGNANNSNLYQRVAVFHSMPADTAPGGTPDTMTLKRLTQSIRLCKIG